MTKRILAAAFILLAVSPSSHLRHATAADEKQNRPNVIVVMVDQLRADVLGAYGGGKNISTPHMDRLAQEGIVFENGLSTYPLCTPYRGMLMTGRLPCHSGLVMNFLEVNPNQRCLAHVFGDAGYLTGFIGKWHLSSGSHTQAGLQKGSWDSTQSYQDVNPHYNFVPPGKARLGFDFWAAYNFHAEFLSAPYYRDEPTMLRMQEYETNAEITYAMECMDESTKADKPFFIVVAPHPPHPPFSRVPEGYLEQVREDLVWEDNVPASHRKGKTAEDARGYYAMCKNTDDNIGRLLDYLDRSGLAQNTIVVLTADHGEMLGSHDRRNKMVPYAEAVRIPVIMRWPGHIPAGSRTDTLHTPIDNMPTLCSLAGLETPNTADGIDLSPVVLGQGEVDRDAVLMMTLSSHWDFFQSGTNWPEWRGVKTKQYTYVKWLTGAEELYDDQADPLQMKNLIKDDQHQPVVERLRTRLEQLLKDADDDFRPGTEYAKWYTPERKLVKTPLGPVEPY